MAQIELHSRGGQNKTTQIAKKHPHSTTHQQDTTQNHFERKYQQQIRQDDKPKIANPS